MEKSARAIEHAGAAAITSALATFTATWLYLRIVLGEPFAFSQAAPVLWLAFGPSITGALVVLGPAALLGWNRHRVNRIAFVVLSVIIGASAGFTVAWLTMRKSPHISFTYASTLMAATWALGALVLSFIGRSPNSRLHRT